MGFVGKQQFQAFRTAYVADIRPDLEAMLLHLQESKAKTISAVTKNQRVYAETSEDVEENGTNDEKNCPCQNTICETCRVGSG